MTKTPHHFYNIFGTNQIVISALLVIFCEYFYKSRQVNFKKSDNTAYVPLKTKQRNEEFCILLVRSCKENNSKGKRKRQEEKRQKQINKFSGTRVKRHIKRRPMIKGKQRKKKEG